MNYDVQPETESVMKMIMDNPFVVSFHLFNINTSHSQIDCRVLVRKLIFLFFLCIYIYTIYIMCGPVLTFLISINSFQIKVPLIFKFKYILFIINFFLTNPFYYQFLPNQSFFYFFLINPLLLSISS